MNGLVLVAAVVAATPPHQPLLMEKLSAHCEDCAEAAPILWPPGNAPRSAPRTGESCGQHASEGTVTYNGICSPNNFPPYQNYSRSKVPHPTYLDRDNAPVSINISVGRQLFVDQFLVEVNTKAAASIRSF
jgi:hypothetical protein